MSYELLIQHGSTVYQPVVKESVKWETQRKGTPGKLTFSVLKDEALSFTEGDPVRFKDGDDKVFYGFVFKKARSKKREDGIDITAYDQLRYFKNKDTYVYTDKTASEFISMIAEDFNLNTGDIEDTEYVIESRTEENSTLFDMAQNALDLTLTNTGELFVLYDNFGSLSLQNIASMKVNLVIDEETGDDYDYETSIDDQTYDKIKLSYDNEDEGTRDIYIAQDSENINQWGVLQYYDTLEEGEDGETKADTLLELYNQKTRKLSIKDAFGDNRVRAGSMIIIKLNLGDTEVFSWMLVETCTHSYGTEEHLMDLTMIGGEFIA